MSKRLLGGLLPVLILFLGFAMPAAGQERLKEGLWTGTVFTPDGQVFDVSYDVSYAEDALGIELILPAEIGMGNIVAGGPVHEGEALSFTLEVGESVSCSLVAQADGSYEGECIDSTGEGAIMTMMPPEDG